MLFYFNPCLDSGNLEVFTIGHNNLLSIATDKSFPYNNVILWYEVLLALFLARCYFDLLLFLNTFLRHYMYFVVLKMLSSHIAMHTGDLSAKHETMKSDSKCKSTGL